MLPLKQKNFKGMDVLLFSVNLNFFPFEEVNQPQDLMAAAVVESTNEIEIDYRKLILLWWNLPNAC